MKFIQGSDRSQTHLFPVSLESSIEPDNEVRLIDLFVSNIPLSDFGFKLDFIENGRPAYHPKDLLKLFIYGYLNKMRSSRDLEKSCKRNIEVMWLMKNLQPDHNTIANFRKDNPKAIKKVFRASVSIAKHFNLIGGKLLAGDSTKFRAQNSKKNNFNANKIARHIAYIDGKLDAYHQELSVCDTSEKEHIEKEIDKHTKRKLDYQNLEQQLKESDQTQISMSDPDSRQMITRNNITEVAYNVQTTVDAKHNIPIDYKVTNTNDSKAMGNMLQRSKTILRSNEFTVLYDKGYHTGSEFKTADDLQIDVMVAIPTVPAQAPDPAYNVEHFQYDQQNDYYTCPQGSKLTTTGKWHKAKTYLFKRYTTKDCKTCPVKHLCTKATYGKGIQRSEFQAYIQQNKERIQQNKQQYRKRQAIVEHPYGTIKRQWGFSYILTKKYHQKASADVGLMFLAYNLRRIFNILGASAIKSYLEAMALYYIAVITRPSIKISRFNVSIFRTKFWEFVQKNPVNRFKFNHILT
ncbi:IS1182 family transposase [Aquimarina aggregata]|uniref:IS1182 family transposase n=2 Tax=Aquimarina aggregata TaxID=1642818 RepID=UPI0024937B49|nr:IS1182 family transposase [Aquimarina aggregata]